MNESQYQSKLLKLIDDTIDELEVDDVVDYNQPVSSYRKEVSEYLIALIEDNINNYLPDDETVLRVILNKGVELSER